MEINKKIVLKIYFTVIKQKYMDGVFFVLKKMTNKSCKKIKTNKNKNKQNEKRKGKEKKGEGREGKLLISPKIMETKIKIILKNNTKNAKSSKRQSDLPPSSHKTGKN